jgi:nucleoside-diphosphate-sugar epimerase
VPIDAAHPLRPTDPYGISKLLGEELARSFERDPPRGLQIGHGRHVAASGIASFPC